MSGCGTKLPSRHVRSSVAFRGKADVVRVTKLELVINLKTAKELGLDLPARILALADAVVE